MRLQKTILFLTCTALMLPLFLRAKELNPSNKIALETTLSTPSVYLGEPLLLTVSWKSTIPFARIKAVDFSFPLFDDPAFRLLSLYQPDLEHQPDTTGLPVHGTRILATRKTIETSNKKQQSLTFKKILIPQQAGMLQIPASTLLCATKIDPNASTRNAFLYPAYFDNTFFDQELSDEKYNRIYTRSNPLPLQVKPLPAGAPPLFSGLVGTFQIEVSAKPKQVHLGDPVLLTLTISTPHFAEAIQLPPLRRQSDLASSFKIPEEIELPQLQKNAKTYTIPLRPQSTSITSIPPIRLVFFDPSSQTYRTIQSDPIPLKVLPAKALKSYGLSPSLSLSQKKKQNHAPTILFSPLFRNILLLLLALPLAFLLLKLIRRAAQSSALAYPLLRFRLPTLLFCKNQTQLHTRLDHLLRVYLGQRFNLQPSALTFREINEKLAQPRFATRSIISSRKKCDEAVASRASHSQRESAQSLEQLFLRCETYRFTPPIKNPAQSRPLIIQTHQVVKKLEKALRES